MADGSAGASTGLRIPQFPPWLFCTSTSKVPCRIHNSVTSGTTSGKIFFSRQALKSLSIISANWFCTTSKRSPEPGCRARTYTPPGIGVSLPISTANSPSGVPIVNVRVGWPNPKFWRLASVFASLGKACRVSTNWTSESNCPTVAASASVATGCRSCHSPSLGLRNEKTPLLVLSSIRSASRTGKRVILLDSFSPLSVPGVFFCRKLRAPNNNTIRPVATNNPRVLMELPSNGVVATRPILPRRR